MIAWLCVVWRAWQGLAAAYVSSGVLPSSYFGNEHAFFLRSDDTDRTIQSGQALFTGMYPPAASGDTEVVGWNTMDRSACSTATSSWCRGVAIRCLTRASPCCCRPVHHSV